ncbi:hypothetical protein L1887_07485 [Cichorium endivia]|nr:hypothetical protein L1887_07485 [Cichorium endivia]
MSTGKIRKVSPEEVQKVQNLIEQCLSRYMTKKEVIDILNQQQNIEPTFTKLVWERLEEQNQQFFRAYHLSLILKDQINQYNDLLEKQAVILHQVNPHGVVSNATHIPISNPVNHNNAGCYVPENVAMKVENMQQDFPMVHGGFNNGGQIVPSEMEHGGLDMVVAQNSNGFAVTRNGYFGDSRFVGQADYGGTGGMESHPPVSSFGIMDPVPLQFHGTLMDDTRSSQLLRQFSHDTSLHDTTADFNNSIDVPMLSRLTSN